MQYMAVVRDREMQRAYIRIHVVIISPEHSGTLLLGLAALGGRLNPSQNGGIQIRLVNK